MSYVLDANVFIEAKNRYYGFDFCPAFWDWLSNSNEQGRVYSIDKVAEELKKRIDDISHWVEEHNDVFFLQPDEKVIPAYGQVSNWVTQQNYEQAAVNSFLQDADYYLIAFALAYDHVVVTHELPSNSKKKIKIPDVCRGLEIEYSTTFEMLREEGAKFILGG